MPVPFSTHNRAFAGNSPGGNPGNQPEDSRNEQQVEERSLESFGRRNGGCLLLARILGRRRRWLDTVLSRNEGPGPRLSQVLGLCYVLSPIVEETSPGMLAPEVRFRISLQHTCASP